MRFGVVFPTYELELSRDVVLEWAGVTEAAGLDYVQLYDHVVMSAAADRSPLAYTDTQAFREPMVLGGFLAACSGLEVSTGVVVAPQRQTVLLAKQAAELALLTGGRFRLGLGVGSSPEEFQALGSDFETRGLRIAEQIELMRELWAGDVVTFEGEYHHLDQVRLVPCAPDGSVPVWLGGWSGRRVFERIGRLADGWIVNRFWGDHIDTALPVIRQAAVDAGRDPDEIGLQGLVEVDIDADPRAIREAVLVWRKLGATHVSFVGLKAGRSTTQHLEFASRIADAVGLL